MRLSFPIAVVLLGVVGCMGDTGSTEESASREVGPQPTSSTAASYIPRTYRFDITSSCGERGFLGSYRVSVQKGHVVAVRTLDRKTTHRPDLAEVPSLQDLLDMAGSAGPEADVQLLHDSAGRPTYLSIDHWPDAEDDEECYEIDNIRPLNR